jgi:hypothetical protein
LAAAKSFLKKDPSPNDEIEDDVACVHSLGNVIRTVTTFPAIYGTYAALDYFKKSPDWKGTLNLEPGNVIINATGTGNGSIRGHCGIILENGRIASNNSATGLWTDFYTLDSWKARYRIKGGMKTYVFELV